MQWSQASDVLGLEVWPQAQNVYQGHLRTFEASPMKWCALLLILDVDVHSSLSEIVNAHRLVLLGSDMHNTSAELVPDI